MKLLRYEIIKTELLNGWFVFNLRNFCREKNYRKFFLMINIFFIISCSTSPILGYLDIKPNNENIIIGPIDLGGIHYVCIIFSKNEYQKENLGSFEERIELAKKIHASVFVKEKKLPITLINYKLIKYDSWFKGYFPPDVIPLFYFTSTEDKLEEVYIKLDLSKSGIKSEKIRVAILQRQIALMKDPRINWNNSDYYPLR